MYLTEEKLGNFLNLLYPGIIFIHNKVVPKSSIKNRPDYRSDDLNIIVEFDGYRHYSLSSTIINDKIKDLVYTSLGYKVIRIPYFIQLSEKVIFELFEKNFEWKQKYPHGFICNKALLPSDFCELGIERFKQDLNRFDFTRQEIQNSIKAKIKELGEIELVLPKSLFTIL